MVQSPVVLETTDGPSRNRRSVDSFVRALVGGGIGLADKAVRAPRKFASMNKILMDGSTDEHGLKIDRKKRPLSPKAAGKFDGRIYYVRAAGFLAAWSMIVSSTLFGTCSNVSGSIEYDARPFDSERMAVA